LRCPGWSVLPGLKGNPVKIRNSSRCCNPLPVFGPEHHSLQREPLSRTPRNGKACRPGESQKTCRNGECFGKKASLVMRNYRVVLCWRAAVGCVVRRVRPSVGCCLERVLSSPAGKERPGISWPQGACRARDGPFSGAQAWFRPSGSGNNTLLYTQYINLTIVIMRSFFVGRSIAVALLISMFSFSFTAGALAENRSISGIVSGASDGEPLVGASVQVKGTGIGTVTDVQGEYRLDIPEDADAVTFSSIGYEPRTVAPGTGSILNVSLNGHSYSTGEIVVYSTRSMAKLKNIPRKVEIVSEKDIEALDPVNATDLLKKTSGVDIIEYPGVLSGVSIRGFSPDFSGIDQNVTYLIDGRPAGATNLATIDMNNIERVEVIKGPSSALYGSQGMGGSINFITRKSAGALSGKASLGYSSFSTLDGSVRVGGSLSERFDVDLGVRSYNQNEDYTVGSNTLISDPDPEVLEQDIDTMRNSTYATQSGNLRIGYQLNDEVRIDARGEIYQAHSVKSPGSIWGVYGHSEKDIDRQTLDVTMTADWGTHALRFVPHWSLEKSVSYKKDDEGLNYRSSLSEIEWLGFQLQDRIRVGRQTFTGGVDYTVIDVFSRSFADSETEKAPSRPNQQQSSLGVFGEVGISLFDETVIANIGGRYDITSYQLKETPLFTTVETESEEYDNFNPSVSVQYRFLPQCKIHASIGRAFVAPNPYEKAGFYVDDDGMETRGNPDLEPETSVTWDAGLTYESDNGGFRTDVTCFSTDWENFIQRTSAVDEFGEEYKTFENLNSAEMNGIELECSYDFGAAHDERYSLRLFTNFTHLFRARSINDDGSEGDMLYVRRNRGSMGLEYDDFRFFSARLTARYIGDRFEQNWIGRYDEARPTLKDPVIEIPASLIFDMSMGFRIDDQNDVSLIAKNILDENYTEKDGYNMPGRSLGVRYSVEF